MHIPVGTSAPLLLVGLIISQVFWEGYFAVFYTLHSFPFSILFFLFFIAYCFSSIFMFYLGWGRSLGRFFICTCTEILTWFWTFPLWRVRGSYALPHVNLFCLNLLSIYLSMYFGRWIIFGFVLCVPVYCFPSLWFVTSNFKFLALIFFFISSPSGGFPAFVVTPP